MIPPRPRQPAARSHRPLRWCESAMAHPVIPSLRSAALLTMLALTAEPSYAQATGRIQLRGQLRTRGEAWQWFEGDGRTDYAFSGTLARLSLSQDTGRFDWQLEVAAPILLGLPLGASGPGPQGQFGLGAAYSSANGNRTNTAGFFPMQAFLRFHSLFGRTSDSLRVGRFQFADGAELTPTNPTLATLKSARIQQRLIGTFAFTHVQRAFYGVQYEHKAGNLNVTGLAALPTRGVFQTDGWGTMKTGFAYGAITRAVTLGKHPAEWRLVGIYYDDWRTVAKSDNRPAALRQDGIQPIRLATLGGHFLAAKETPLGIIDVVAWAAMQGGKWGALTHEAAALDLEAGIQPPVLGRLRPWFRAGFTYASGDGNPNDRRHGTFFQLLPTPRAFAQFPFFNMMNNQDVFGILTLRPGKRLTLRHESHWLRLASKQDLWYSGGGAFQPWTFGFSGRPSNGSAALANVYDVTADLVLNTHTSATFYGAYATGRTVIREIYRRDRNGAFGFIELTIKF